MGTARKETAIKIHHAEKSLQQLDILGVGGHELIAAVVFGHRG